MSSDGMVAGVYDNANGHTTVTTEVEEEEGVLEEGKDYKLSIMRKKRTLPLLNNEDNKNDNSTDDLRATSIWPNF